MFDTIRMSVSDIALKCERLRRAGWVKTIREKVDGEGEVKGGTTFVKMVEGGHPHYWSYVPEAGCLKVETSLPKVLGGENVSLVGPGQLPEVFERLSNTVSDEVGDVPPVESWDVRGRLDAVFAWRVVWDGKNWIGDYLHAFKNLQLPRHYAESVDRDSTLYWRNRSRVIRMYDKQKETNVPAAKGLLRFEVQMNRTKSELGFTGGRLRVGDVLNWETAKGVLEKYLHALGGDLVIADDEKLFRGLVEAYGFARARRLFGSVMVSRMYSDGELKGMGVDRTMVWRDRSQVKKAGLGASVAESGVLPPLTLPNEYTGEPGQVAA